MRRTAPSKLPTKTGADGLSLKMKREYQDIEPARRTRLMAIINTGDKERIRKAFSQVDISVSDFLKEKYLEEVKDMAERDIMQLPTSELTRKK